MKVPLLIVISFWAKFCFSQDSTAAVYIHDIIQKIESRITTDILERKDKLIYDEEDSLKKGPVLMDQFKFYTNPQTMLLDKIIEKSSYRNVSTELIVYFSGNQPVFFTNRQWEGKTICFDFDIYYMNDNPVFWVKRKELKGIPDGRLFLKWCYELRTEYMGLVQEYNQTFARRSR